MVGSKSITQKIGWEVVSVALPYVPSRAVCHNGSCPRDRRKAVIVCYQKPEKAKKPHSLYSFLWIAFISVCFGSAYVFFFPYS